MKTKWICAACGKVGKRGGEFCEFCAPAWHGMWDTIDKLKDERVRETVRENVGNFTGIILRRAVEERKNS